LAEHSLIIQKTAMHSAFHSLFHVATYQFSTFLLV